MTAPTEAQIRAGAERLVALGQQVGNRFIQSHAGMLSREVLDAAYAEQTTATGGQPVAGTTTGR